MNKKHIYTIIALGTVALNAAPAQGEANSQNERANTVFVCSTQQNAPTMFAYTPGEVNLAPVMTWHSEYLLPEDSGQEVCQQTAQKLQASIEQKQKKYIKADITKENNSVCLVSEENQTCATEKSEKLFSVNPDYQATCVLDNKKPLDCWALRKRGIYSFEDKPYQAVWWPW